MSVERIASSSRQRRRRGRIGLGALIATAVLVVGPATALAQSSDPASDQYDNTPEQIEEFVGGGGGDPGEDPNTASSDRVVAGLPFTGLDLGLLVAAAALLGASGLVLRRLAGSGARH
jgi:hypothetical protein